MKLIRFFNTYEPVTTFYRDLCPYLAGKGYKVEIYLSGGVYRDGRGNLEEALKHENIGIFYLTNKRVVGNNRINKIKIMTSYMLKVMYRTIIKKGKGLNCFLTQPPLFAIWGIILKYIHKENYICVIMDIYPDIMFKHGLISERSFLSRILRRTRNLMLKHADLVIVIGRCMRNYLLAEGLSKKVIRVIPNWINEEKIFHVSHKENDLRHNLGITRKDFVVMYSGNMGVTHDFTSLIEVTKRLRNVGNLKFVFIGNGKRQPQIARETNGLDNVIILPFQPTDKLSKSLSTGDLHFVTLRQGFEGLVVPSKTYGAFATARPVIYEGSMSGEIAKLITESNAGTVIPPGNVDLLEKTILEYKNNRGFYKTISKNAHKVSMEILKRKIILDEYYSNIDELLTK